MGQAKPLAAAVAACTWMAVDEEDDSARNATGRSREGWSGAKKYVGNFAKVAVMASGVGSGRRMWICLSATSTRS